MIHRAKFQNFKALRDVEVTFDSRLTVLVGPNGSGKTSVLQGIHSLCQLVGGKDPSEIFIGRQSTERVASRGVLREMVLQFWASAPEERVRLLALPQQRESPQGIKTWWLEAARFGDDDEAEEPSQGLLPYRSAVLLRLDASRLASPSYTDELPPKLNFSGGNLASVLAYMALNRPTDFLKVVTGFRSIIPSVEALRFDRESVVHVFKGSEHANDVRKRMSRTEKVLGDLLLFDFCGAPSVQANLVSEGTLHTLGLLTAIQGPERSRTILLDDLGLALHPKAQTQLVELLQKLLIQYSDLQIIATSHSPYILDKLKPSEVRVMALRDDGSAACGRLEDHPKYPMWKDSMSPGEFWTHAGEDWVKQLTPQTAAP